MKSTQVKILLVEDDKDQLSALTKAIRSEAKYEVLAAEDAAVAMKLADEHCPDLIISDHYMPGEDGFTFCRKVKSHPILQDTMFILLTQASEIENRIKGFESGADDYMTKPYHLAELMARIRVWVRIKGLGDELKKEKALLAQANAELEADVAGVIQLLTHLIGLRVINASIRADRAARMTQWIGERTHMEADELKMLEVAARLHEIGKISFPDSLLKKASIDLTEEEKHTASHFPVLGQLIVSGIPRLTGVGKFIRHQMENYDGTGYPDRLMKDHIPLPSRILRAVNAVEHVTLGQTSSIQDLIVRIEKLKGTVLDPHLIQLVVEYLEVIENPTWMKGKRQVSVNDLGVGMVIAHDLNTGNGMKLLSNNSKITLSILDKIHAHHQYDPILNNIYVYESP